MAKKIEFSVSAPPSETLLERMADFLVRAVAKQEGMNVSGTVVKRRPGDTGFPVKGRFWETNAEAS